MRRTTKLPEMSNLPPPKKKVDQAKEIIERAKEMNQDGAVGAMLLNHSITAAILASLIALGFWLHKNFQADEFFTAVDQVEHRASIEPYLVEAQRVRMSSALEVYFRLNDRYPPNLEALVDAGLLRPADMFYPAGRDRWEYRRREQNYDLNWSVDTPR